MCSDVFNLALIPSILAERYQMRVGKFEENMNLLEFTQKKIP